MTKEVSDRVLYTTANVESDEAKAILRQADVDFQEVFIDDPEREQKVVPQLLTLQGFFPTLYTIRWYAQVYGKRTIGAEAR